jgi:transposase-like protein
MGTWAVGVSYLLALPAPYRARLRTTNAQERLNEELRRRERVIRIFPSRTSVLRLLGALLMELEEQWTTGHRYLQMETYWQWKLATETAQKGGAPLVQIV